MQRVMITGVYGLVGGAIYRYLATKPDEYTLYGLARRRHASDRTPEDWRIDIPDERFVLTNLSDLDVLVEGFKGIDTVVHMAANPDEFSPYEDIAPANIHGARNIFEACARAGVKRLVFASTVMTCWGYREVEPYKAISEGRYESVPNPIPLVSVESPPMPQHIYACSKLWSEALGRMYSNIYDLSCLGMRIGWVIAEDRVAALHEGPLWCSHRDIARLAESCINAPENLRFDLFFGVSNSYWRWFDIDHGREVLGWEPLDWDKDHMDHLITKPA